MQILDKTTCLKVLRFLVGVTVLFVFAVLSGCDLDLPAKEDKSPGLSSSVPTARGSIADLSLVTETRKTYQWYCAQCHGENGYGDGVNAPYLVVPPRDHTKADYLETRSDQQLFNAIKLGGLAVGRAPCMPGWAHTLDDKTIRSLVSYIRNLCNCKAL